MVVTSKTHISQPAILFFLLLYGVLSLPQIFGQTTPGYQAPGFRGTNGNPGYSNSTTNVGSIINATNANTYPTSQQTLSYINSNPAFLGMDPGIKSAIVYSGAGPELLNGAYLPNGAANPFYQNGKITPNGYVPSTGMSWQGVQQNGFLPISSVATHYGGLGTTIYNPTIYNNPRTYTPPPPPPSFSSVKSSSIVPTQSSNDLPKNDLPKDVTPSVIQSRVRATSIDLAKATASRKHALALSETAGDKVGQVANHAALAELFIQLGQLDLAFVHIRAAETIQGTTADPSMQVETLRAKSAAYMAQGQFESAINTYRQVLAIPLPAAEKADIQISLGWAYQSMGDIRQALRSYEEAQALFTEAGDKDGKVRTALAIGSLYESIGEPAKAVGQYRSVAWDASNEQLARMLVSTAETWLAVNRPDEALKRYEKALSLIDPPAKALSPFPVVLPPWESAPGSSEIDPNEKIALEISILSGVGRSHMALKHFWTARNYFEQALEKAKSSGKQAAEASIIASLGELEYWNEITYPRITCWSGHQFGQNCSWEKRGFATALKNYQAALPLMRAAANRIGEIGVLTSTGLVYDAQGKRSDALGYYRQALEQMDDFERSARLEEFRINIANQSAGLYQRAIELEVARHHMEQALNFSERARARTLRDQ